MVIEILTIYPDFFDRYLSLKMASEAISNGIIDIVIKDIRDYSNSTSIKKQVDDKPFGGGAGMLMAPQPIFDALEDTKGHLIHMSPRGQKLDDKLASELSNLDNITILCSHFEGIDQRVIDHFKPQEISIGDYVLSGGEISALVLIDTIIRKIPGVIRSDSLEEESFTNGLLEYDQYTRPREFRGYSVPDVLVNGNHKLIEEFRLESSIRNTIKYRPDLIEDGLKTGRFSTNVEKKILEIYKEDLHE